MLRVILTYWSDWCRMNFLVLFLTIRLHEGAARWETATPSVGSAEEVVLYFHNKNRHKEDVRNKVPLLWAHSRVM